MYWLNSPAMKRGAENSAGPRGGFPVIVGLPSKGVWKLAWDGSLLKVKGSNMTDHRILREKLAPDFLRELDQHEAKLELHAGSDFGPRLAHALVQDAARARASDVHLEPGSEAVTVRFRVDGVLSDVTCITSSEARILTNQLKTLASLDPVMSFVPRDAHASCAVETGQLNLRLALTPSQTGEALTIRLMDPKQLQRSIEDLGLAAGDLLRLESWIEEGAGMFLAAGPTGCGKTTTVYSLLHKVKKSDRAVVSLEDPVEYQIDGIVQVQLDERHHLNFGEGIRQMLRMDPDYLMLGEIRDSLSARAAVDAALSGRALLSTLHCRDAVGAVTAPIKDPAGVYVMRVDRRVSADRAAFDKQLDVMRRQRVQSLKQQRLRLFLEDLRKSAKVEDHRKDINATIASGDIVT